MKSDPIFVRCKQPHQGHWIEPVWLDKGIALIPGGCTGIHPDCYFPDEKFFTLVHAATGHPLITHGTVLMTSNVAERFYLNIEALWDWTLGVWPPPRRVEELMIQAWKKTTDRRV